MPDHLSPLETKAELSRREALKLLAGAVTAAQACVEPPGDIVRPYARQPASVIPGQPSWFATSMTLDGLATGLLVESHEGRPTKVEGNPEHPASLGGTLAQHQASVLDLYDPARAQAVTRGGVPSSWRALLQELSRSAGPWWLLVPDSSSPLEASLLAGLANRRELHVVRQGANERPYEGTRLAFGAPYETQLDLRRARTVLSLDADLFALHAHAPRWARDFASRKRAGEVRSYVVEPMLTATGALADQRLALRAGDVTSFALGLTAELRRRGLALPELPSSPIAGPFVRAVANDLLRGDGLIAVGDRQPAALHALAHVLNRALGARVTLTQPALVAVPNEASPRELEEALHDGLVGTLLILDCNPAYYGTALRGAKLSVHFDRHHNETSALCHWHAPLSHYLESWGDARARDGTLSIVQPLVRPLYDSRSKPEILAMLAGERNAQGFSLLHARRRDGPGWEHLLTHGFDADSAFPAVMPELRPFTVRAAPSPGIELALNRSPTIVNERFANNAWLQELPHPRTKQTWGNALLMGTPLATRLGVEEGALVRVEHAGRALEVPAFVVPEHADEAVTLELGYGRNAPEERMAHKVGVNAAQLGGAILGVTLRATGRRETLARTQNELDQHDRELAPVLHSTQGDPLRDRREPPPSTQPVKPRLGPQWAMTIDTNLCSGCGACVVACQSENNIPVVGKREVMRGREMHWLRIDSYRTPQGVVNQPMMCQHCEHAPCEYVCPVFATEHSPDGLNEMTYQRCIGTRFCSQNCPYKVRRFNWLHYSADDDKLALQKNPEVTVRDRGVMEKCTYCVQRIRHAEYQARMEKRAIRSGEVISACQQACPTHAIQFGMLHEMRAERESERAYGVLNDLGTRPRTMYLAKLVEEEPT